MMFRYLLTITTLLTTLLTGAVFAHDTQSQISLIKKVKRSVVGVGVYDPLGAPRYKLLGTGFAVKVDGDTTYIATNHHVVNGPAYDSEKSEISVHVGEGKEAKLFRAQLVKQDERSDVAVIKIKGFIKPLKLTDADIMSPSGTDIIIAGLPIGSVLGLYKSVHKGMVAAFVPMAIPQSNASQLSIEVIRQLRDPLFVYQLDATAYPGNSGSPVVHSETGQVIAILNSVLVKKTKEHVLSDPSGISYAIPAKYIWDMLPK